VDITHYVINMLMEFPKVSLGGNKVKSPWNENLFKVQEDSPRLSNDRSDLFHTVTAQGLFLCKRARPDICPAIAFLTTRVTCSTESDWEKLERLLKYLQQTVNDRLTLLADGTGELRWHVDAPSRFIPTFVATRVLSCPWDMVPLSPSVGNKA
jgi:hypothetical protein